MRPKTIVFFLLLSLLFSGAALAQGGTLSYGSNVVGTLSAQSPLAFYTFNGTAADLVTIDVIGISPGLDPAVSLNSPTQQQLANNDNNPSAAVSTDARISLSLPQTGLFTVLVSSVTGTPGDFLIRLSGQPAIVGTPLGDTPSSVELAPGIVQSFTFDANPDAPTTLNVTTTTPGFAFQTTVRDSSGAIVAILGGSDTAGVSLNLPAGTETYTVQVNGVNPNMTGQISISIGSTAAVPLPTQPDSPVPAETEEVPAPAATEEIGPPPSNVCVVTPGQGTVNVRSGPGTNFNVIAQLQPGQSLTATGIAGEWYQVNVPGVGPGYVASAVVNANGPCNNLPLVTTDGQQQDQQPAPPTFTYTPSPTTEQQLTQATPTSTATATTQQQDQQVQATATYTPSYTPTTPPPPPTAPPDANFNSPLTIPLDSTASTTDFVSYPGGDPEDRVRWDINGMNPNSALSGGRARLILAVSCFGTGTQNITFFTGGQTFSCGQTIVDREVTYDSRTGQVTITAVGGENTYVQWVLTGTATRVN